MPRRVRKERTKKKQSGAEGETIHPNPDIEARMGEEEKNRKQKEETGSWPQPSYLDHVIASRTFMDHTVGLF